uniref:Spexin hormone n=1 Tax=Periophthalmus magnuspinnatus TaxID=409849 RepID=A0A3B4A9R0_9GOBI
AQGLRTLAGTSALTALLLATYVSYCYSAPKNFQRRNWTPQAMLYLKGTQGRRFVSEDHKEGDVYDTLHLGEIFYSQSQEHKLQYVFLASVRTNFKKLITEI